MEIEWSPFLLFLGYVGVEDKNVIGGILSRTISLNHPRHPPKIMKMKSENIKKCFFCPLSSLSQISVSKAFIFGWAIPEFIGIQCYCWPVCLDKEWPHKMKTRGFFVLRSNSLYVLPFVLRFGDFYALKLHIEKLFFYDTQTRLKWLFISDFRVTFIALCWKFLSPASA